MKILIMPSWYPNETNPLWGNYFIKQAEALTDFANISFININRVGLKELNKLSENKKNDGFYDKKYKFAFYEKSIINYKSINIKLSYKHYQKAAYQAYKELIKHTGKPDAILVESTMPAGYGAMYISEKENIPYIIHEHSYDVLTSPAYSEFSKEVVMNASYAMGVNEKICNQLKMWNENVDLMPNYIDTEKFDVKSKESKEFTLLSICNFYKVKALEILLEALNKVIYEEKITDIHLNIVGNGDFKEYYETISHNLKLDKYVTFKGLVPNEEIPNIIAESNCLCISSRIETFGIPIIESFAVGKPVITTECGGPNILVNEERGIKVPVDNIEEYKKAIIEMKKNYKKYDTKKIKEYANTYDKKVICKKIIQICENIIKKDK